MAVEKQGNREKFERPSVRAARAQKKAIRALQILVLIGLLLFVAFPVYWLVIGSFKTGAELFETPSLLIDQPTLKNYFQLVNETRFLSWFKNSLIVAGVTVIVTPVLATLAGYGLSRSSFRGKRNTARSVLFTYMFPPILLGIPLYSIFYDFDMLNSYEALILSVVSRTLPFTLWIMWQFFQTIPRSYEESAWINGAHPLRALWDIVLPMARPGIIAITIFTFAAVWNDFTFSVIVMTDPDMYTLPVGIQGFIEQTAVHWGLILSAGALILLPSFIIVLTLQKYIIEGFSASGLD